MIAEEKDKKLIHIINEAERDFPFSSDEIKSLKQDRNYTAAIRTLNAFISSVTYKSYDYGNFSNEFEWNSLKVKTIDFTFPLKPNAFLFPQCMYFKMVRPKNMQGIDFASFKTLQRLYLSYRDSNMDYAEYESIVLNFLNLL